MMIGKQLYSVIKIGKPQIIKSSGLQALFSTSKTSAVPANTNNSISHAHQPLQQHYLTQRKEEFLKLYKQNYTDSIKGFATSQGTQNYQNRRANADDLTLSSVGLGSYVGDPDQNDDLKLFNAIIDSVRSGGVNVLDTAINYRYMKSERTLGAALRYLEQFEKITREELFICTQNGYIPEDADSGTLSSAYIQDLVEEKLITQEDVVGTCHSMNTNFLNDQLNKSLRNIGVDCVDLLYIHNPAEAQMPLIGEQKFYDKLAQVFQFYETKVSENQIKAYGMATWVCFRSPVEETKIHLSFQKVCDIANQVAGQNNNFKYIQLPMNVIMPEAFVQKWQDWTHEGADGKTEKLTILKAARLAGINVISSSPLLQGTMIQVPMSSDIFKCSNLGAKHIQFIRSIPAPALLRQKTNKHVKTNLEVINHAPLTEEEFKAFLKPRKREQGPEQAVEMQ